MSDDTFNEFEKSIARTLGGHVRGYVWNDEVKNAGNRLLRHVEGHYNVHDGDLGNLYKVGHVEEPTVSSPDKALSWLHAFILSTDHKTAHPSMSPDALWKFAMEEVQRISAYSMYIVERAKIVDRIINAYLDKKKLENLGRLRSMLDVVGELRMAHEEALEDLPGAEIDLGWCVAHIFVLTNWLRIVIHDDCWSDCQFERVEYLNQVFGFLKRIRFDDWENSTSICRRFIGYLDDRVVSCGSGTPYTFPVAGRNGAYVPMDILDEAIEGYVAYRSGLLVRTVEA